MLPYQAADIATDEQVRDLDASLLDEVAAAEEASTEMQLDEDVVALPLRPLTQQMTVLHTAQDGGFLFEVARRKVRNCVGRHEIEWLMELYGGEQAGSRHWVSFHEFEVVGRSGRVGDDS